MDPRGTKKAKGRVSEIKDKRRRKEKDYRVKGEEQGDQKFKGDFTQTEISLTVTHVDQACLQKSQFGSLERGEGKSQSWRFDR